LYVSRDLFSSCGEIVSVSDCEKSGDAQTCVVEFKSAEDAKGAIELSGMELGDRKFVVEFEKPIATAAAKGEGENVDEKHGEKDDKEKKEDDDDDDSDRRSKKRKKKRDRDRRRRRDDSRDSSRGRRRRSERDRDRRRKRGRRRRRRDSSDEDSSDAEYRKRKRNVNPTPTKFWDGFQWHDISAGQPQGLENRPLASQVNMSQLLQAQREAMASVQNPQ